MALFIAVSKTRMTSSVPLIRLRPNCFGDKKFFFSKIYISLTLIILSKVLQTMLVSAMGR